MTLERPALIVWDFDGVLNRNVVGGRFVWSDQLATDLGLDPSDLSEFLFASGRMGGVIRGKEDLRDVVGEWLARQATRVTAEDLLAYWFEKDALPDDEVITYLDHLPCRHAIGTNNERRRAAFIETNMGFGARVAHVFASGRMGVAKPDAGYFHHILRWADIPAAQVLLIDDHLPNVEAARALGWQSLHFTDGSRDAVLRQLYSWT
ncbi:MAG: HAD-IA family hydrolase [Pseudomonadota bacterium]